MDDGLVGIREFCPHGITSLECSSSNIIVRIAAQDKHEYCVAFNEIICFILSSTNNCRSV